jgi:hypothetical protein
MSNTKEARDDADAVVQKNFLFDRQLGKTIEEHDEEGDEEVVLAHELSLVFGRPALARAIDDY